MGPGLRWDDYDANGNSTSMRARQAGPSISTWDSRDLLQAYGYDIPDDLKYYYYDGMGSRVASRESVGLTYYDWDGIGVLQEKNSSGSVTDRQVHGYAPITSVGDIALMDKSGRPTCLWRTR